MRLPIIRRLIPLWHSALETPRKPRDYRGFCRAEIKSIGRESAQRVQKVPPSLSGSFPANAFAIDALRGAIRNRDIAAIAASRLANRASV